LGKKYGVLYPKLRETVARMNAEGIVRSLRESLSVDIQVEGRAVTLLPEDVEIKDVPLEGYSMGEEKGIMVGLNTIISKELALEGLAKDIVRRIQNQRKEAGFNIADEIETYYEAGPRLQEVLESYGEYIASETLSKILENSNLPRNAFTKEYTLDGEHLRLGLILSRKSVETP
jgi:isoleucyl-tRNA synthetase